MILESAEVVQALEVDLEEAVPSAARAGSQAPQDPQETMANQERAEPQEAQETQEDLQLLLANRLHLLLAIHVPPDPQDHQEAQAPPEMQVPMVTPDREAEVLSPDHQDQRDHQDHPDQMDNLDNQDRQVNPHNLKKLDQDNQDLPETQAHQDHQDQQDNQGNQEVQALQGRRDQMGNQELQETMDSQVTQVNQELQVDQVRRAYVLSTALSMVESSSKTEPADVKFRVSTQRTRGDLPNSPCPMNQQFPFLLLVAQKTAIYYVSFLYCAQDWGSIYGLTHPLFFLK